MGMKFGGFDEFDKRLARLAKQAPVKRNQFVAQEAEVLLGKAKENTPTGSPGAPLKNGWHRTTVVDGVAVVFNNVEYAAHVEYGHRQKPGRFVPAIGKRLKRDFVPGKKMLHRAMLQSGKSFKKDAEAILKGLIDA